MRISSPPENSSAPPVSGGAQVAWKRQRGVVADVGEAAGHFLNSRSGAGMIQKAWIRSPSGGLGLVS